MGYNLATVEIGIEPVPKWHEFENSRGGIQMNKFQDAFKHIRNFPRAFWVVIVATLINQLGNMAFVFLMVYVNKHLGYSLFKSSIVFATFGISTFIAALIGGVIIDTMGAAKVLIFALLGNALTLFSIPFIHQFYALIALCSIWGVFYGISRPASQTLVSFLSQEGIHKITFSIYRLVINLGMSIGPVVGGYMTAYSFSALFFTNCIANILACIILLIFLERKWFEKIIVTEIKSRWSLRLLKQDKALTFFLLSLIPVIMVFFQHESTLPIFIYHDLNLPLSFYGWLLTICTLLIVFCELPLNIMTINWSYRTNFVIGSFCLSTAFMCLAFAKTEWHLAFIAIFWTIGEMILFPASSSYIADIASVSERGSYMSLYNATFNISLVMGPLGGAMVMQQFGAQVLWLVCGCFGMLSTMFFWGLRIKE